VANTSGNSDFAPSNLTRNVTFYEVGVAASAGVNKNLTLSCSVAGGNATSSQVYVGAESPVVATASLFGVPVYDAPLNLTFAEFVPTNQSLGEYNRTSACVGLKGSTASIPVGANFLRVACIYTNHTNQCLDADIAPYKLLKDQNWSANCDGIVNLKDLGLVTGNWKETVPPANPFADINHDGIVNLKDLGVITAHLGQTGTYLPSFGAVAVFRLEEIFRWTALAA
jgi:hypothetical protein